MIDSHTEELAALYVLDAMDGAERVAFEKRIREEEDVARLVRGLSNGLHHSMKQQAGPERMDLLEGIHREIEGAQPQFRFLPKITRASAWAAAAMLLLGLNLVQLWLPVPFGKNEVPNAMASEDERKSLEDEIRVLRSFNESWEKEYMHLAQRMLPFFESRDGIGRYTVIDMVAVQNTPGNGGHHDFDDLSEYFLSQRPQAADGLSFASVKSTPGMPADSSATVGFTVWRNDEQRGFIDVYNLPQSGPGTDRFLWVRSGPGEPYLPVGFLPDLDDGSGSMYFTVDQQDFTLTGILISEESPEGPGEQPSSRQVMVGP